MGISQQAFKKSSPLIGRQVDGFKITGMIVEGLVQLEQTCVKQEEVKGREVEQKCYLLPMHNLKKFDNNKDNKEDFNEVIQNRLVMFELVQSKYSDNIRHITQFNRAEMDQQLVYIVEQERGVKLEKVIAWMLDVNELDENFIRLIFLQLTLAIYQVHSSDLAHQNIRLWNVRFIHNNLFRLKISEFGHRNQIHMQNVPEKYLDPKYIAPEMLTKEMYEEEKSTDIWTLGIILQQMVASRKGERKVEKEQPFQSQNNGERAKKKEDFKEIFYQIKNKNLHQVNKIHAEFSDVLRDVCMGCLEKDASSRLQIKDLIESPWFKLIYDQDDMLNNTYIFDKDNWMLNNEKLIIALFIEFNNTDHTIKIDKTKIPKEILDNCNPDNPEFNNRRFSNSNLSKNNVFNSSQVISEHFKNTDQYLKASRRNSVDPSNENWIINDQNEDEQIECKLCNISQEFIQFVSFQELQDAIRDIDPKKFKDVGQNRKKIMEECNQVELLSLYYHYDLILQENYAYDPWKKMEI